MRKLLRRNIELLSHPVDEIRGSKSTELQGVNVALCVSGSVAAYRAIDLARELLKRGASVKFVATKEALRFVTPTILEWASGSKPITRLTGATEHISIAGRRGWAHVVVVAPATLNTMCKIAHGIADSPVTATALAALGSGKPVVLAPAMHIDMYESGAAKKCLEALRGLGVRVVEPEVEDGRLKMAEVVEIVDYVEDVVKPVDGLTGLSVLVTAGPTREHLDPIRFMSNASSGAMGVAFASVCLNNGADVQLVMGPTTLKPPRRALVYEVTSARDMLEACLSAIERRRPDIVVLAAAPADFEFEERFADKVKSEVEELKATLKPTPKIAVEVRRRLPDSIIVGFKAEHGVPLQELLERAKSRMLSYGFDAIVANDVSKRGLGFGSEFNEGYMILKSGGVVHLERATKRAMAREILKAAVKLLREKRSKTEAS